MWFKEKKEVEKPVEYKKRTKCIFRAPPRPFEVGKTWIELTFLDKRKFKVAVIGDLQQYVHEGRDQSEPNNYSLSSNDLLEPFVQSIKISNSLTCAQLSLGSYVSSYEMTYVDDPTNPKKAIIGQVRYAKILKTENYQIMFEEAFVKDKEQS